MKIIISDLDGTLLMRGEDELHRDVKRVIDSVINQNIIFCVASGRSYSELKRIMKGYEDKIYFIPSDGSLIVHKEENLYQSPIDKYSIDINDDKTDYVLHGKYLSYVKSHKSMFVRKIKEQYRGHVVEIAGFDEVDSDIYKISVYGKCKEPELNMVYNDYDIKEYVNKSINKGVAVKKLLDILSLKSSDALAVGDSTNDVEMFDVVGESLAMIHSSPSVKKRATGICMNFADAVSKFIKE